MNRTTRHSGEHAQPPHRQKTPMDVALRFLTARARTTREMELHLDSRQYGEFEVQQTIERLQELGYLDDAAFAEEFIRTRLNTKPVSRRKLREQLLGHFIQQDIVDAALSCIDDDQEWAHAIEVAEKYAAQITCDDPFSREQRLAKRLYGRGFSQELSIKAARKALQEEIDA